MADQKDFSFEWIRRSHNTHADSLTHTVDHAFLRSREKHPGKSRVYFFDGGYEKGIAKVGVVQMAVYGAQLLPIAMFADTVEAASAYEPELFAISVAIPVQ